jgi:hypothetical protein
MKHFIGIASGTHTIYVRDTTTGCEVSTTVTLQPATPITGFNLNTTPVVAAEVTIKYFNHTSTWN